MTSKSDYHFQTSKEVGTSTGKSDKHDMYLHKYCIINRYIKPPRIELSSLKNIRDCEYVRVTSSQ